MNESVHHNKVPGKTGHEAVVHYQLELGCQQHGQTEDQFHLIL